MNRCIPLLTAVTASLLINASAEKDLAPLLEPILKESNLPSIAAALVVGDEIRATGAVGVRKLGDVTVVTVDDKYHLGSCTKPMTATLVAILIEDGLLTWQTTIGDVLRGTHRKFKDVTIEQLLSHTGGLAKECPPKIWAQAFSDQGRMSSTKQRQRFVDDLLSEKPDYEPGTKTDYSNQGYAVVGVMLETLAKKPWEDLMRERLFKPLGMDSAGFRAPQPDQPWGHSNNTPVAPEPRGDNPDAIGPAGTVHMSIKDWAKFARFHLQQEEGKLLKKPESFEKLNSTLEKSGKHGVGGWLVQDIPGMGGHCLQMTGSNTMWFSLLWIIPGQDKAIVVTTNSAQKNAFETCDKAVAALLSMKDE